MTIPLPHAHPDPSHATVDIIIVATTTLICAVTGCCHPKRPFEPVNARVVCGNVGGRMGAEDEREKAYVTKQ